MNEGANILDTWEQDLPVWDAEPLTPWEPVNMDAPEPQPDWECELPAMEPLEPLEPFEPVDTEPWDAELLNAWQNDNIQW